INPKYKFEVIDHFPLRYDVEDRWVSSSSVKATEEIDKWGGRFSSEWSYTIFIFLLIPAKLAKRMISIIFGIKRFRKNMFKQVRAPDKGVIRGIDRLKGGLNVFIKLDWNVKRDKKDPRKIKDNTKIRQSIGSIREIFEKYQYGFTAFHSGRPKAGEFNERESVGPIVEEAERLFKEEGLDIEIVLLPYERDKIKGAIDRAKDRYRGKKILFVFENIRFYEEEKSKDAEERKRFREWLKEVTGAEAYVNCAFESSHNDKDASMELVYDFREEERAASSLVIEEISKIMRFEEESGHPYFYMFGGIKWDKLKHIANLVNSGRLGSGDCVALLGGLGIVYNHYIKGDGIGGFELLSKSIEKGEVQEKDVIKWCKQIREGVERNNIKLITPLDHINEVGKRCGEDIPEGFVPLDIGEETIEAIKEFGERVIRRGKGGIVINGGAGRFEDEVTRGGTKAMIEIANKAAERGIAVFAVGGDMHDALQLIGDVNEKIIVTTGGGVVLAALAKGVRNLKSIAALISREGKSIEYEKNLKKKGLKMNLAPSFWMWRGLLGLLPAAEDLVFVQWLLLVIKKEKLELELEKELMFLMLQQRQSLMLKRT
ncbi:MAG: phosphoglycerate kinase, partial [Candidatus Aminicenantes bacterium]